MSNWLEKKIPNMLVKSHLYCSQIKLIWGWSKKRCWLINSEAGGKISRDTLMKNMDKVLLIYMKKRLFSITKKTWFSG